MKKNICLDVSVWIILKLILRAQDGQRGGYGSDSAWEQLAASCECSNAILAEIGKQPEASQ
jgi:hypothetical protein